MSLLQLFKTDRNVAFAAAVFLHGTVLFGGEMLFMRSAEYGVESGANAIQINIISAVRQTKDEVVPKPEKELDIEALLVDTKEDFMVRKIKKTVTEPKRDPVRKPDPKQVVQQKSNIGDNSSPVPGQSSTTFHSAGGAQSVAKPNHLKNKAPVYPWIAKENRWEGLVILKVVVSEEGGVEDIAIEQSSGHKVLDDAAYDAVKKWKFHPAQIGTLALKSRVRIPVRFVLEDAE